MNDFKRFLKLIRVQNDENTGQMADKLGISKSYLSQFESGIKKLTTGLVNSIKNKYLLSTNEEQFLDNYFTSVTNDIWINIDGMDETRKRLLIAICFDLKKADDNQLIKIRNLLND